MPASGVVFSGEDVLTLKPNIDLFRQAKIMAGAVNPSITATSANAGSIYLNNSNSNVYRKTDNGLTTNWVAIGTSAVVGEWTAYTPTFTGFGTVATSDFRYRQVGSSYEIQGRFLAGTPTAVEARISLPNGGTSSANYVTLESAGQMILDGGNTGAQAAYTLIEPSVTYMTFSIQNAGGGGLSKRNGNAFATAGQALSVQAFVQIAGLSGTVPVAYLPVAAKYTGSATTISGTPAVVVWATSVFDTSSAMSAGVFTVPAGAAGNYQVNVNVQVTGAITLNLVTDMLLQQNGVTVSEHQEYAGGAMTALNAHISDILSCSAGDTIRVQLSSTAVTPVITNSSKTWISIVKVN